MREIKDICRSIKCVVSSYPSYILSKIIGTIFSLVLYLIPVMATEAVVKMYYANKSVGYLAMVIGIMFLIIPFIYMMYHLIDFYDDHLKRLFIRKESIIFYKKLNEIDYAYQESPEFLNNYTRSLERSVFNIYDTCNGTFRILEKVIVSIGMFLVIARLHYGIILFAVALAVIYTIFRYFMGKIQFLQNTYVAPFKRITKYIERAFTLKDAMAEIKTTDVDKLLLEKNNYANDKVIKSFNKYTLPRTILAFFANILLTLIYPAIILLISYFMIDNITEEVIAGFSSMTVAATTLSTLISSLTSAFALVQTSVVECKVPFDLLDRSPNIEKNEGKIPSEFKSLDISNVSFSYDEKEVLSDISLHIKKGQKIAIVGENGAGKTTLVKLILRLYDGNKGAILYNNIDYKELNVKKLRNHVGAVFQNIEVYALTIAENILLKTPNSEADYNLINEALEFSGLKEYVLNLPNGIDTIITKEFDANGVVLSKGLMQRLALARGYARGYELFILDEPSSALDALAEAKVYNNMMKLGINKTIIFISHRLTTTVNADYIYMFEKGHIIEQGTHQELIKLGKKYKEMFTSQSKKYLGGEHDE